MNPEERLRKALRLSEGNCVVASNQREQKTLGACGVKECFQWIVQRPCFFRGFTFHGKIDPAVYIVQVRLGPDKLIPEAQGRVGVPLSWFDQIDPAAYAVEVGQVISLKIVNGGPEAVLLDVELLAGETP